MNIKITFYVVKCPMSCSDWYMFRFVQVIFQIENMYLATLKCIFLLYCFSLSHIYTSIFIMAFCNGKADFCEKMKLVVFSIHS